MLPRDLHEYRLPYGEDPSNLFYLTAKDRKPYATDQFKDLYVPPLDLHMAEELQKATHSEYMVVYPLSSKGKILGAIVFNLNRPYNELEKDELDLLEAFTDEAGIGIDSVRLYAEIQERNDELRVANDKLTQLDRMKDELVSIASHELRTPMTAIKSYLWMALNKQSENLNPDLIKYLERAYISSDRMIDLVNDMLSASRLEGGRVELDLQACEVYPILEEVVEQLIPKANEKGLKMELKQETTNFHLGVIDANRIREVLFNIIGNSVKYTDSGSITVTLSEHTKISPDDGTELKGKKNYLWIEVSDTGRGVAKEDMERLFKKFSKLEQESFTKTAETGGTGLGLYITKGLVELHGGKIWVKSEGEGKGSTFGFSVRIG
jgi:signal transduction histidine kinase